MWRGTDNYATSPSQCASSPQRQKGRHTFTFGQSSGNVVNSEIANEVGRISQEKEVSDAIERGVVDGMSLLGLSEKNATNIVVGSPDLSFVQEMMQEFKLQVMGSFANIRNDLQSDLSILQQEILKNRENARAQAELVLQELGESKNEIRKLANIEFVLSEVVNSIRQIDIPQQDVSKIADTVEERLQRSRLRVDNSEILQGLRCLEVDQIGFANLITDRVRKLTFNVDHNQVLNALQRFPDEELISKSILEKSKKMFPDRSDFNELLDTVVKTRSDPNMTPMLSQLEKGQRQIMDTIGATREQSLEISDALRKTLMQEISAVNSASDQRLAGLEREIWHLRDGLAAMRVAIPQTQAMVSQVVQQSSEMQRTVSLPRVVAEVYGPKVSMPAVPISETVQVMVHPQKMPIAHPQEFLASSLASMEVPIAADGYTSPTSPRLESPQSPENMAKDVSLTGEISPGRLGLRYTSPTAPRLESPCSPENMANDVSLTDKISPGRLGPPRGYHVRHTEEEW